jgi:hypothetical protein
MLCDLYDTYQKVYVLYLSLLGKDMIRILAYRTGIILIATLLVMATGGFSLYHHICHCAGEVSSSVFLEAGCDHAQDTEVASCCTQVEAHSCCSDKPVHESEKACHDDDCCQTSLQFFKISDSFQPGLENINLKPFQPVTPFMNLVVFEDIPIFSFLDLASFALPPPEAGRDILVSLHQLKLDTHLV